MKKSAGKIILSLFLIFLITPLTNCVRKPVIPVASNTYIVTSGGHTSHAALPYLIANDGSPAHNGERYVIWSDDLIVMRASTAYMLQLGYVVVERSRLDQLFKEQQIGLTHSPEDIGKILRVGRLADATHVLFAETQINSAGTARGLHMSVLVRSVAVESGQIQWSGMARFPTPIISPPEPNLYKLTEFAINRAICPVGDGWAWKEASSTSKECGCFRSQS
jgi:hypothetical protein